MDLHHDEIHLYFTRPKEISDANLLKRYEALLSDNERQQMARFYYDRHRHQYLLTRALIRTGLSRYYDVEPSEWVFTKNAYDKPEVAGPDLHPVIRFNISHSKDLVMCGFARNFDIGVDVEDCQRSTKAAFTRLSSYFSAREIKDLADLPRNAQQQRFFDYWTLKESYIKARGGGFSIPLSGFSFEFERDKLTGFNVDADLNDNPKAWQFWRISMPQNHRVAIAVNSGDTCFKLKASNTVPLISLEPVQLEFL